MSKYKKKDCYNYMPSVTDKASESDGEAKQARTTGESKHYIRLNENRCWKLMWICASKKLVYSVHKKWRFLCTANTNFLVNLQFFYGKKCIDYKRKNIQIGYYCSVAQLVYISTCAFCCLGSRHENNFFCPAARGSIFVIFLYILSSGTPF
jgi:hypothetical protein